MEEKQYFCKHMQEQRSSESTATAENCLEEWYKGYEHLNKTDLEIQLTSTLVKYISLSTRDHCIKGKQRLPYFSKKRSEKPL